jgi:hypothetical protein
MIRVGMKKKGYVHCLRPAESSHNSTSNDWVLIPLVILKDIKSSKPNFEIESHFWDEFQALAKKHQTKVRVFFIFKHTSSSIPLIFSLMDSRSIRSGILDSSTSNSEPRARR